MAKVKTINLDIPQGSTYTHDFYVKEKSTRAAKPLTDFTARMQIRETIDAVATVYDASVGGDLTISGSEGKITLTITDETTAAWAFTEGFYDLEAESPGGEVFKVCKGTVTVDPEVTR